MQSFKQVTQTNIPQGVSLNTNVVTINADDNMLLTLDSPLVYDTDSSKLTRSVQLVLVEKTVKTWPVGAVNDTCKRSFTSSTGGTPLSSFPALSDLSLPVGYVVNPVAAHGTTPCMLQYAFFGSWENILQDCNFGTMHTVTEDNVNWWKMEFNIMARWQDKTTADTTLFETDMWWPVTIKFQLDLNQSTESTTELFDPYVSDSFRLSSAILTKFDNNTMKVKYDYSFKTRYPFKPSLYDPVTHGLAQGFDDHRDSFVVPPGWAEGLKTYVMASSDRVVNSMLIGQSCETGGISPLPGDECIQTGTLEFSMPTDQSGYTPGGVYNLQFDNDCTSWYGAAQSNCAGWPIFGQGYGETGGTTFDIPVVGAALATLPVTSGYKAEPIADAAPTASLQGANSRMDFIATYELAVAIKLVRLEEMILEQIHSNGTVLNTWTLVSKGVYFPLAVSAKLNFTYNGWPAKVDCTANIWLTVGPNKTVAFLTPDDEQGVEQSFRATMTMSLDFDPFAAPSQSRKRDYFPGWAASTTVSHTSSVGVINFSESTANDYETVVPYVADSFNIPHIAYQKNGTSGNTTIYVEYQLRTRFPYMITESTTETDRMPVLLLPGTSEWTTAQTHGWLRSEWAVARYDWQNSTEIPLTESECINRGWFNFIVPTEYLCDPAGTFEMVWDLQCFQTDPMLCNQTGHFPGTFEFVLTPGINLCAAPAADYNVDASFVSQGSSSVGSPVHLTATHAASKKFYSTKLMTMDVQETDQSGVAIPDQAAWRLWENGAKTSSGMGQRVAATVEESWYNASQTTSIKDIYFTPNVGGDKIDYMVVLADRSKTALYFRTTITTRFFFDSLSYNDAYPARRMFYRDSSVQLTSTQVAVDKCTFSVNLDTLDSNVETTLPTGSKSIPVGLAVGLAAGCVAFFGALIAVALIVRRRRHRLDDKEQGSKI